VTYLVSAVEGLFDLPVGDVVLAVDAVDVDGEQHGGAVPGPVVLTLQAVKWWAYLGHVCVGASAVQP